MFDNMSSRERVLALLVIGLLPLFLLFGTYTWVSSTLASQSEEINRLRSQKRSEKIKQITAMEASRRRAGYRAASLPAETTSAATGYYEWIFDATEQAGLNSPIVSSGTSTNRSLQGKLIYFSQRYTVNTSGTLESLVEFLYRFYSKKYLHRITSLNLSPASAGNNPLQSRGEQPLNIVMTLEFMSLPDANNQTEMPDGPWKRLDRTLVEYKNAIVHRNIFGPPNTPPEIRRITTETFEPNEPISFRIAADDPDPIDQLRFELVSASSKRAVIEQQEPGDSSAIFKSPGLEKGTYRYEVRVTDDGCPPKAVSETFSIEVEEPQPTEEVVEESFKKATITTITGLTRNRENRLEVWIYDQSGEELIVEVGESFELDGKEWTVRSHDFEHAVIECDGQLLTYEVGSKLSEPIESRSADPK